MQQRTIGRYRVLEEIASGGQGTVYRAWETTTGRVVALKVLHPHLSSDAGVLERFRREAQLAAAVTHPNITQIFEVGRDGDYHFISMEYLPLSIQNLIESQGALPIDRAADICYQTARALEAASGRGIIHRDIKPQNLLLSPDGVVKVTDFGIARATSLSTMTRTGAVMGTPHYMSPEQARGQRVDTRSDLYSLGIVFYQMLTGRIPFEAETPWEVIRQHIEVKAEPVRRVRSEVPRPLERLVERCLEKRPDRRYQSAGELASALREAVPGTGGGRRQQSPVAPAPAQRPATSPAARAASTPSRAAQPERIRPSETWMSSWARAWSRTHRNRWAWVGTVLSLAIALSVAGARLDAVGWMTGLMEGPGEPEVVVSGQPTTVAPAPTAAPPTVPTPTATPAPPAPTAQPSVGATPTPEPTPTPTPEPTVGSAVPQRTATPVPTPTPTAEGRPASTPSPTPFETDREALVALYNATDGRNWFRNDNWLSDKPIKEWAGVRTDDAGRVVALTLTQNRLIGEMPAELGNLANLTHLFLADNLLSGEIPAELGNLTSLEYLYLRRNQLSGEIPAELGNLFNLTHLVLDQNQVSGEIPPEWGNLANLTEVTLLGNRFTPGPLFSCYRVSDCPEYAAGNRNSHWYTWQAALYPPPSEDSIMRYYHDTGSLCEDDEPECDTAYTLLELRLMDYPLAMALDGLYWLRDGVTKDEASFVDAVYWLMSSEMDRYGYVHRDQRWLRPPEGQPLPNIVGIADLQWVRDGITDYEASAMQDLKGSGLADRSIPDYMVDGIDLPPQN